MRRPAPRNIGLLAVAATAALAACGGADAPGTRDDGPALGPVDGWELSGTDLERLREGDPAPDFALASLDGEIVRLSDFRGTHDVILVFYRGHW